MAKKPRALAVLALLAGFVTPVAATARTTSHHRGRASGRSTRTGAPHAVPGASHALPGGSLSIDGGSSYAAVVIDALAGACGLHADA